MKTITIAVREFALPVPRTGSIDAHSGFARSSAEGREIHGRIQKAMKRSDRPYEAEVRVAWTVERGDYRFRIEGRIDGLFNTEPPVIEEIKSTFALGELAGRLSRGAMEHPYCLQLQTYGYLYWRQNGVLPLLRFHLVSTRNGAATELEIPFDLPLYERWLELRLDELVSETRKAEKRSARRRKLGETLSFPFPSTRPGQTELMDEIEEGMAQKKTMLIQAPTGLGKTAGVLFPVLREALRRGQNLVYVTPKNSQHAVAEDAVERFKGAGFPLRALTVTAKGKICFHDEPVCSPDSCEYAADYFGKLHRHGIADRLAKRRTLKARTFRKLGAEFRVCPFELQLEYLMEADVVICDYNYVFSPRSPLARISYLAVDEEGKPNLVVDEAHNLPSRAMEYYSPRLAVQTLECLVIEARSVAGRLGKEFARAAATCRDIVAGCGRTGPGAAPHRIEPPIEAFREQDLRLQSLVARHLESEAEIGTGDPVIRLSRLWSDFTDALEVAASPERSEFSTSFHPHAAGGSLCITCCDASAMIRDRYKEYRNAVLFSATLKPFQYYGQLSGLDSGDVRCKEFLSPFPRHRRKLLIIPQVSTRYSRREHNYRKIAEAVHRLTALRPGNYLVFFPSFEFLDRVATLFTPPAGFVLRQQIRAMAGGAVEEILHHLRLQAKPTIVFAVQGGSLSEGIDYAGETVIGAFVVGPPLPSFGFEREEMRRYYEWRYGEGFAYAYAIPAMAKAVQAAGRVIRSETDRGLVVLMDDRFLDPTYSSAMPEDWFEKDVAELVSTGILAEVDRFWNTAPPSAPPAPLPAAG